MLDGYVWFVLQEKDKDGKMFAWAERVHQSLNLFGHFSQRYRDIISINVCKTKKEAQALAKHWNDCAKENGNYKWTIFD